MKPRVTKGRDKAKPAHGARLTQMIVLDALRSWVIPTAAAVVIFLTYMLYNLELVDRTVAVTLTGLLLLFALLFFGLRDFLEELPAGSRAALLAGFAVLWGVATFYPFYRGVNPGVPLFSAELMHDGPPITIPLHDKPGHYNVFLEGNFLPAQGRENRIANYQIALGHDGSTDRLLEGTFRQEWHTQRVGAGRRSSLVPVMEESTLVVDELDDPEGRDLTMQLKELAPGTRGSVSVRIYPSGMPKVELIILGALTVAAALVVDAWRPKGKSEGLMGIVTVGALVGVAVFRGAAASPGFPQIIVGGLAGAIGAAVAGMLLTRLVRPLRQYVQ